MLSLKSHSEVMYEIASRAKELRLATNLSQKGMSVRSGVSLGSVKRFESTGKISLESLLKIALVLESLEDFNDVFTAKKIFNSLDEIIKSESKRSRGREK